MCPRTILVPALTRQHAPKRTISLRVMAIKQAARKVDKQKKRLLNGTKEVSQAGPVQRVLEAQESLQQEVDVKKLLTQSLLVGLTFGTAFQVTHNNGLLPVFSGDWRKSYELFLM